MRTNRFGSIMANAAASKTALCGFDSHPMHHFIGGRYGEVSSLDSTTVRFSLIVLSKLTNKEN